MVGTEVQKGLANLLSYGRSMQVAGERIVQIAEELRAAVEKLEKEKTPADLLVEANMLSNASIEQLSEALTKASVEHDLSLDILEKEKEDGNQTAAG